MKTIGLTQLVLIIVTTLTHVSASGTEATENTEMIPQSPNSKGSVLLHTVGPKFGGAPYSWVFTHSRHLRDLTVTAENRETKRVQKFTFQSTGSTEPEIVAIKLPPHISSGALGIRFDSQWTLLAYDPEKRGFVVVKSNGNPRKALRLDNPEIETSKSGKQMLMDRSGGNAAGSVSCWQPNANFTKFSELVRVDIATDAKGNRFEFAAIRSNGAFRGSRLRYLSSHWWNTSCAKLLEVSSH